MAGSLQSAGDKDGVRSLLKCFQQVDDVDLTGAGQVKHLHIGRIAEAHGAGKISRGIGTEVAGKGQDLGFKVCHRLSSSECLIDCLEQGCFLGKYLLVRKVLELDCLGRALCSAQTAAAAGGGTDLCCARDPAHTG